MYGIRSACVLVSGGLAALGGAYPSRGVVHLFDHNMTAGGGLIAQASQASLPFNVLPYLLTIIAAAGVIGTSIPSAAVGRPYTKP